MNTLERAGQGKCGSDFASARFRRGQAKDRPQPLPAGEKAIAHCLVNGGWFGVFFRKISIQRAIDQPLPRDEIRFQFHGKRNVITKRIPKHPKKEESPTARVGRSESVSTVELPP
jgi:hypothetical protein